MSQTLPVDRNGLQVLDREECFHLLGTASIGRIGVSMDALPVVLPINFRLVDDRILFRTNTGTKLDAATANAVVSFEVDDFDSFSHTGWSVMVIGTTREITAPDELEALRSAHIPRWAPVDSARVVEIATKQISGRRIAYTNGQIGEWDEADR